MRETNKTKTIASNKKAFYDYFIEETIECGVSLKGNEVKSVRNGKISVKESWVSAERGGLVLKQCNISPWDTTNSFDCNPTRDRQLLLHKYEIRKISAKAAEKGFTIVPLDVHISNGKVKMNIGICKGKHSYNKRLSEKEKNIKMEIKRAVK